MECCLCEGQIEEKYTPQGEMYWDSGNNAQPVKDGRCCGECNIMVVIPKRLEIINLFAYQVPKIFRISMKVNVSFLFEKFLFLNNLIK